MKAAIRPLPSTLSRHFEQSLRTVKMLQRSTLSWALGLALGVDAAHAQQVPNIGDAVRQAQPSAPVAATPPTLPALGNLPTEPPMRALPGGGTQVLVTRFAIVGNHVIGSPELQALVQPEQGKTLRLSDLEEIAARLTRYYRSHGYFVARAYIPAQQMQDGTLSISVVEGNYGKFVLLNKSRVRDEIVQGLLDDVKDRDIVSLDTLERAMLVINDTPGVKVVQADVMPGEKVGTSDFAVSTAATPAFDGYVLLDNYGSIYTGQERLSFSGDWNSPSERGDRLSAAGMVTRASGLVSARVGYSALVGTDGTRAEAGLSQTTYKLGGAYAALDASGTATGADLNLTKPLKRTRADSVDLAVGLAYRDLKDDTGPTVHVDKQLASVNAGVSERREHALFDLDGTSVASARLTLGRLHFRDATAAALDASGTNTQGTYAKLNLAATRVSILPAHAVLTASVRAQVALNGKSLDGVERMSVSGDGGVTAYPINELSGDHAALLHADLAHALPLAASMQLNATVFANYGWAKQVTAVPGADSSRSLSDVGIALSGLASNGLLLKLQVAHRLGGGAPASESASPTRVLVQVGWTM